LILVDGYFTWAWAEKGKPISGPRGANNRLD